MTTYQVLGVMSGSSLDGLDLAYCRLEIDLLADGSPTVNAWSIDRATTLPFPAPLKGALQKGGHQSLPEIMALDVALGKMVGRQARDFCNQYHLQPDFIAFHGHTVLHAPDQEYSLQIGSGAHIAEATGFPVINDFRRRDMAAGGQGAPLAPLADHLLFPDYTYCLNLGGIANLSINSDNRYLAGDITGVNQVLNALAAEANLAFDAEGTLARTGKILPELLRQANSWPYLDLPFPKSLDNQTVQDQLVRLFTHFDGLLSDRLRTAVQHIALQVARSLHSSRVTSSTTPRLLVTGGGAHNTLLMEVIKAECQKIRSLAISVPSTEIINYKEALLMALLGVLRYAGHPNCVASATGARHPVRGGVIHLP